MSVCIATLLTTGSFPLYAETKESDKPSQPTENKALYTREVKADITEKVKHIGAIKYGKLEHITPPSVTIETLPRPATYGKVIGNSDEIKRNVLRIIAVEKPSSPRISPLTIVEGYATLIQDKERNSTESKQENSLKNQWDGSTRIVTAAQWLQKAELIFLAPNTSEAEKEYRRFAMKFNNRTGEKILEYAKNHGWIPLKLEDTDFTINLTELRLQTPQYEENENNINERERSEKNKCIKADFSNRSEIKVSEQSKICGEGFYVTTKVPNLNQNFYSISLINKEQLTPVKLLPSLDPMGYYYQSKGCPPLGAPLIALPPTYVKRQQKPEEEHRQVVGICAYSPGKDPSTTYAISYQSLRRYLKLDKDTLKEDAK